MAGPLFLYALMSWGSPDHMKSLPSAFSNQTHFVFFYRRAMLMLDKTMPILELGSFLYHIIFSIVSHVQPLIRTWTPPPAKAVSFGSVVSVCVQ